MREEGGGSVSPYRGNDGEKKRYKTRVELSGAVALWVFVFLFLSLYSLSRMLC